MEWAKRFECRTRPLEWKVTFDNTDNVEGIPNTLDGIRGKSGQLDASGWIKIILLFEKLNSQLKYK